MYRTGLLPLLLLASLALPACAQDNTAQANHLPAENTASPMTRFPAGLFRSGFYVDVDTPCESASNANTLSEDIGARRLHGVFEELLEDISYNAGGEGMPEVDLKITAEYVRQHVAAAKKEDLKKYIL